MNAKLTNLMRVMLTGRETYRVPRYYRGLRVRSGRAWLTVSGYDHVLKRGDEMALRSNKDYAVVAPVGRAPVVLELLGEAPCDPCSDPRPLVHAL